VLGVIDDVRRRLLAGFPRSGVGIWLLGETREEFGGSAWAWIAHRHLGGSPPSVDLAAERALAGLLAAGAGSFLVAAHDCSDGGLAQCLVECCLRHGVGARITLAHEDPFVALFSESAGRAVVSVPLDAEPTFVAAAQAAGVPAARLGDSGGDALAIAGVGTIPIEELRAASEETLPRLFG